MLKRCCLSNMIWIYKIVFLRYNEGIEVRCMYCSTCGTKLIMKRDGIDGFVPFCMHCHTFKYPTFNDAISSVIFSPDKKEILLIQQYGRKDNVLVAGYVTKGEKLETTLKREIEEEVHLEIERFMYNDNQYYERTNTLITNFMAVAKDKNFKLTGEVDQAQWFSVEDALKYIKPNSLAQHYLKEAICKIDRL